MVSAVVAMIIVVGGVNYGHGFRGGFGCESRNGGISGRDASGGGHHSCTDGKDGSDGR